MPIVISHVLSSTRTCSPITQVDGLPLRPEATGRRTIHSIPAVKRSWHITHHGSDAYLMAPIYRDTRPVIVVTPRSNTSSQIIHSRFLVPIGIETWDADNVRRMTVLKGPGCITPFSVEQNLTTCFENQTDVFVRFWEGYNPILPSDEWSFPAKEDGWFVGSVILSGLSSSHIEVTILHGFAEYIRENGCIGAH